MSVWLGLDTATDLAGLALLAEDGVLVEHSWWGRRRHTAELAPALARALDAAGLGVAELAGIAVAIGPGSYTGLRIGLSLAKGLALGAGLPLVGVPTLDGLAWALSAPALERRLPLWAVARAGRTRLLAGCYPPGPADWPDPAGLVALRFDALLELARPPAWVAGELEEAERVALAAAGLAVLPPALGLRRASGLAALGRERHARFGPDDPGSLAPVYLRESP